LRFGREPHAERELQAFAQRDSARGVPEASADSGAPRLPTSSAFGAPTPASGAHAARATRQRSAERESESAQPPAPGLAAIAPRDQSVASPPAAGEAKESPARPTPAAPGAPTASAVREEVARLDAQSTARGEAAGAPQGNERRKAQKLTKSGERPM